MPGSAVFLYRKVSGQNKEVNARLEGIAGVRSSRRGPEESA
jgi:hypothetical protein